MSNIENILAEILKSLHTSPLEAVKIPGIISTQHDGAKFVRRSVDRNILTLAEMMYEQYPEVRMTYLNEEWAAIVRLALAQTLPSLGNNINSFHFEARQLKQHLNEKIKKYISAYGDLKTVYGCWIFTPTPTEPIEIGPVRFEDKSSWLDRIFESGKISKVTHSRLSRAFTGKRLRRRKLPLEQRFEEIILHQISNAPMICEVKTHGLATDLAYKRAMIAANLALTSIALFWEKPSLTLERFRTTLDGDPRSIYRALIEPKKYEILNVKWEGQLPIYEISPDIWKDTYHDASRLLKIAGKMIDCWVNTTAHKQGSELLHTLSHSLFFFWKACREDNDILSIIEFVVVLETLASGRNKKGILELIDKRLGLNSSHKLGSGKTLNQIIKYIYSVARSRTLHGTNPEIYYDAGDTRAIVEQIARHCLVSCMTKAQDDSPDKDKGFLLTE